MKSFGKYSIPRSVQIHTDSVVPPSIERYDGAHTAPVILATDIGLEGEGPEQRLVVDTVHTTQGSYMDFVDRRIVPQCDFAATALPGMTSELCGWMGEGEDDGMSSHFFGQMMLQREVQLTSGAAQRWCAHGILVSSLPVRWPSTCSLTSRPMQI